MDHELEGFLAERVMGWRLEIDASDPFFDCWMKENYVVYWKDSWHPLRYLSQAWQLIDKLSDDYAFVVHRSHGLNYSSVMVYEGGARSHSPADVFLHLKEEDEWTRCPEAKKLGVKPAIRVQAKTAAEAICVAAAMVKGWHADSA